MADTGNMNLFLVEAEINETISAVGRASPTRTFDDLQLVFAADIESASDKFRAHWARMNYKNNQVSLLYEIGTMSIKPCIL